MVTRTLRAMTYPTTYPPESADATAADRTGASTPRLTGPREVARRLAEIDEHYIRESFVPLDALIDARTDAADVRAAIAEGRLPQPAYRLDDGTDLVPADYFAPMDDAGSLDALPRWFAAEYVRAAARFDQPTDDAAVREQWESYLSGGYQVCLRDATPESIAEKGHWIDTIESLLDEPRPKESDWLAALRKAVDGLTAIERPGAVLDPPRWGGPMSPQWYGAYLRTRYPQAF